MELSKGNKKSLVSHIPEEGLRLTKYSGKDVLERLGEDVIKQVVASILCGKNVRALTEELTQRRITLSNGAMLVAFLQWVKKVENFDNNWKELIKTELKGKLTSGEKILIKAGMGVRFDIGFIGPGNTEISLDKVSRFETHMAKGNTIHSMTTIILVDRIGEGSRIVEMAKAINGHIIQMSMTYWVYDLARILKDATGFEHEILKSKPEGSVDYITRKIKEIKLAPFTEKVIEMEEESEDDITITASFKKRQEKNRKNT